MLTRKYVSASSSAALATRIERLLEAEWHSHGVAGNVHVSYADAGGRVRTLLIEYDRD